MSPTMHKCTNKNQTKLEERCKEKHTKFDELSTREIKAKLQGRRCNCNTKRNNMIN
jgi:hypothetical protein